MSNNRVSRPRSRVPLSAILATLLSVGLIYLVVRTAMAALNPIAAVQLPPAEYSRLLRRGLYELLVPDRRVSADLGRLSRRTALAEPLAFEPFFVQAKAAEQAGRLPAAISLMEEARRRRRNFAPTRFALVDYYTRANRVAETLGELEVALRLKPKALPPVMTELAKLIRRPDGRHILARALARQPFWAEEFFSAARSAGLRPEDALALLEESRSLQPHGDHRRARQLYIGTLVSAGQVQRARQIWLTSRPEVERARDQLMANPGFRGQPAGEPFGWTLNAVDVGRAEIKDAASSRPYLSVDYFGGSNAVLAEQLLALPVGTTYRLRYDLAGQSGSGSSSIYWSVTCLASAPELVRSEMDRLTGSYQQRQAQFTVPGSGCAGQRLRLVAEAGDVPATVNLRIAALEIVR